MHWERRGFGPALQLSKIRHLPVHILDPQRPVDGAHCAHHLKNDRNAQILFCHICLGGQDSSLVQLTSPLTRPDTMFDNCSGYEWCLPFYAGASPFSWAQKCRLLNQRMQGPANSFESDLQSLVHTPLQQHERGRGCKRYC